MSGLNELLRAHDISEEELLQRSARLERWRPEDRALARAREQRRKNGSGGSADAPLPKPRSGRGLGRKHFRAALAGRPIPRIPRAKLLRALADALRHRDVGDPIEAVRESAPVRPAHDATEAHA